MPYHSFLFTAFNWISTYIFILFASVALACTLYYIAELAEEYSPLAKICIQYSLYAVLASHVLLMAFDDTLSFWSLFVSVCCQAVYALMFDTFPTVYLTSPSFIGSGIALVVSHLNWYWYFQEHHYFFTSGEVLAFFLLFVWLVPFALFVSVSVGDSSLPMRGASTSATTQRSFSVKACFAFFKNLAAPATNTTLSDAAVPLGGGEGNDGMTGFSTATYGQASDGFGAPYIPAAAAAQYSAFNASSAADAVSQPLGVSDAPVDDGFAHLQARPIAHAPQPLHARPAPVPLSAAAASTVPTSSASLLRPGVGGLLRAQRPAPPPGKAD